MKKFEDKNFLDNLPDFELEELVISYLQIEKGYYLLSNSVAAKSTTIKIECELYSREKSGEKAVVQVKAKKSGISLYAEDYMEYVKKGYLVYLYAAKVEQNLAGGKDNIIEITEQDLKSFVEKKGEFLPDNIMKWRNLLNLDVLEKEK